MVRKIVGKKLAFVGDQNCSEYSITRVGTVRNGPKWELKLGKLISSGREGTVALRNLEEMKSVSVAWPSSMAADLTRKCQRQLAKLQRRSEFHTISRSNRSNYFYNCNSPYHSRLYKNLDGRCMVLHFY